MHLIDKLKSWWEIESNFQIIMVMMVFTITGFSYFFARRLIFPLI